MKKILSKKNLWIVFLLLIWVIPSFQNNIRTETYFFVAAFSLSVIAINFLSGKEKVFLVILVTSVLVSIYNYSYLFTYLPVLFLIASHKEALESEKNKNKKNNDNLSITYLTLSLLFFLGEIVYSLYVFGTLNATEKHRLYSAALVMFWFVLFFAVLASQALNKKVIKSLELSKNAGVNFGGIYIVSAVFSAMTVLFYYLTNAYTDVQSIRTDCLPWYVFLLCIVFSDDPFLKISLRKIEERVDRFVRDKEVEK